MRLAARAQGRQDAVSDVEHPEKISNILAGLLLTLLDMQPPTVVGVTVPVSSCLFLSPPVSSVSSFLFLSLSVSSVSSRLFLSLPVSSCLLPSSRSFQSLHKTFHLPISRLLYFSPVGIVNLTAQCPAGLSVPLLNLPVNGHTASHVLRLLLQRALAADHGSSLPLPAMERVCDVRAVRMAPAARAMLLL